MYHQVPLSGEPGTSNMADIVSLTPDTQSLLTYCKCAKCEEQWGPFSDQLTMHKLNIPSYPWISPTIAHIYTTYMCDDIHNIHSSIEHVCLTLCAVQTTSKAKQLWAPTISPVWWKSEDTSANKAADSVVGSLLTSTLSRSLLAKPQIHQQPGELYVAQ